MKRISLIIYGLFLSLAGICQEVDSLANVTQGNGLKQVTEDAPNLSEIFSVSKIIWSIIFLVIGYFVIRIITKVLELIAERSTTYRITLKGFVPIVRILSWVILITIILKRIL